MKRRLATIFLYMGFGLAVTAVLVIVKFPWTALAPRLAAAVNDSGVAHLSYLEAKPSRLPPGLVLEGVALASAKDPDMPLLTVGRVRLSPLWGALLLGRAGARVRAECYGGEIVADVRADGLTTAKHVRADVQIEGVDLGRHPRLAEELGMQGVLAGRATLSGPPGNPMAMEGGGDLGLSGGALRYKSAFLRREDIRLGAVQARLAWHGGKLEFERLALAEGDLQGELKGVFQPGPKGRAFAGGRLSVDGSLLVEPSLVDPARIPDQGFADKLRRREALQLQWNGPVAPLVGMAGMLKSPSPGSKNRAP